ncbi:MAG: aconitate hydratase [Deltaproteobacteria bacterium]|nr:aconitate hydratase [Deltaproteobacteria bacterium]
MGKNLTYKILESHLVEGTLKPGEEIAIRIDHTLLQDATGTLAMLNADDHRYLQTVCARHGIHFSPPGNGVSHQVHLERFGVPGKTLLGSDSHTPSAAGVSMLGIGAGGLDVAMAMAGRPYYFPCPRVLGVRLHGNLPDWISAKDVILELLRRYGVKGCVGKVIEYFGPGVEGLSVTDRETIGNMGTELGATSSVFPSDEKTRIYLAAQGRAESWIPLSADEDADYDETIEIDLSSLEPLIACPSSPGNVVPVREVAGTKVHQVIIGSCVNSSYRDLMVAARILEGRHRHPETFLHINPGSLQVFENVLVGKGILLLVQAGARIHQSGCLGCIGMGQAPGTGQVSLRTFPRNFPGRSGTEGDRVYLCSPETAAASAVRGVITDPRELGKDMDYPRIRDPETYLIDQFSITFPSDPLPDIEVFRGPNIKPLPEMTPLPENLEAEVGIKVKDNVSTDTIMPAGSKILPLRSNIDAISRYVFSQIDPEFAARSLRSGNIVVVGGENYGQGSSREHAALAPRYLGVRVKLAKSFARIHKANLCNFGILPLTFRDPADYDLLEKGMSVSFPGVRGRILSGEVEIPVEVKGRRIITLLEVSDRQRKCLLAGGALNYVKELLDKERRGAGNADS